MSPVTHPCQWSGFWSMHALAEVDFWCKSCLPYSDPIKPRKKNPFLFINPCFINPCFINLCFINPVHVLPIQSSPYPIICHLQRVSIRREWGSRLGGNFSLPIRRRTVNGANEGNELKPCLKEKTPSYENLSASSAHSLTVFWRKSYALRWVKGEMFAGKWITGRVQKFVPSPKPAEKMKHS